MKKRISYIDPVQLGKVLAVLYACLTLIFVPFVALAMLAGVFSQHQNNLMPGAGNAVAGGGMVVMVVFVVLVPLFYGFIGFIVGIIAAFIYNLVAGWTGGVEFIVVDVAQSLGEVGQPGRLPM